MPICGQDVSEDLQWYWDAWIEQCAKNGNKKTDRAKEMAWRKLNRFTRVEEIQLQILEKSTIGGWTDIYPPKQTALPECQRAYVP